MRYITAGESHGPVLTAILSEVPAGIAVSAEEIDADLARRQAGYGRGGRMAIETDTVRILSGVRFGRTLGSPVTLQIENRDWTNWTDRMAVSGEKPEGIRELHPRPGHADLSGVFKTASDDCRDVLERASSRETAARVAAGAVAKALLADLGVEVFSYVRRIGDVALESRDAIYDRSSIEASPVRCPDEEVSSRMCAAIDTARAQGESLGGEFTVVARGLVVGLGGYASPSERLTSRLGAAIFSIPAIKGLEFGLGFDSAALPGSQVHDEIVYSSEEGISRRTNRAGGLEGGMTNGEDLVLTAAMKPIPTLMRPLDSIDLDTLELHQASKERSDVCAVPAAGVVAEAETALVLADAYCRKFGGDNMTDLTSALAAYRARVTR